MPAVIDEFEAYEVQQFCSSRKPKVVCGVKMWLYPGKDWVDIYLPKRKTPIARLCLDSYEFGIKDFRYLWNFWRGPAALTVPHAPGRPIDGIKYPDYHTPYYETRIEALEALANFIVEKRAKKKRN